MNKQLSLEASFERYVFCLKFFSLYDIETAPDDCGYQAVSKSQPCGAELFKSNPVSGVLKTQFFSEIQQKNQIQNDGLVQLLGQCQPRVPHSTFVTQSMKEWLKWFFSLSMVEESIDQWAHDLKAQDSDSICDVSQGQVWKKLFSSNCTGSALYLGFSLFIDWFNPLKNKLSGNQLSMGIISLNCLKIPLHLRYQNKYTCLAAIIPSPNQPTMITINNLLRPIIDEIYELNNGLKISTPEYPHGRKVVVKVVTLVCDIVASHKAAGFKSHSANKFCSWCEVNASDQHKLKLGRPLTGRKVLEAANHWKDTLSKFSREKVAIRTGVRWSELNRLPYWDPFLNVILGVMHNWFEGVLKHHLISQWGFYFK
ncbi:hypothetical protein O181_034660 [Austropuccinia psidii MF-1]|uniref:Uncharacterized protein n=1 Tax=Austropuccinia psidii MF-1 TaxID=1389203 RepID=A0A9Q3D5E8_9BASI|nr:hypothetical protein [Austropuccinia psidii MF-1]